jgi:hypothetical protein
LSLRQRFQTFTGEDARGGQLVSTQLNGENISFTLPTAGGREVFKGRASADAMEGVVELPGGKGSAKWTATRIKT